MEFLKAVKNETEIISKTEEHYSYEEYIELLKENEKMENNQELYEFLNDQNERIESFLDVLKKNYRDIGFGNLLKYDDIYKLLKKYITIEECVYEDDDNDSSGENFEEEN